MHSGVDNMVCYLEARLWAVHCIWSSLQLFELGTPIIIVLQMRKKMLIKVTWLIQHFGLIRDRSRSKIHLRWFQSPCSYPQNPTASQCLPLVWATPHKPASVEWVHRCCFSLWLETLSLLGLLLISSMGFREWGFMNILSFCNKNITNSNNDSNRNNS